MSKKRRESIRSASVPDQSDSQDMSRIIFEMANDIIVYVNTKCEIVDVNRKIEDILGYKPEEVKGKDFTKFGFISPKDAPKILKLFRDSVRRDEIKDTSNKAINLTEVRLKHKNGSTLIVEVSTAAIKREDKLEGFVGIVRDVYERTEMEKRLRESEERCRDLFDNSPMGIYCTTPDGQIKMANPALVEMLGCSSLQELVERNLEKEGFEPTYPRKQFKETMAKEGEVKGLEAAWIRKDGSVIYVRENAKAIRDEKERILYYEGTVEDITERKHAEEALQEERNKLQTLVDSMEYGLTIQDRDYKIIYQNEASRSMTDDHLGKKCYRAYEFRDEICDGCPVRMAWEDGESHTTVRKVVTPSGETIFWDNTASPIRNAKGKIIACLEITRNITERKRVEQQMRELGQFRESIIDNANVWLSVLDEKANMVIWNKAAEQISGYTHGEVVGHGKIWEWLYPDGEYRKQITAKAAAIIEKGETVEDFETDIRCKNSETRTISWSYRNLLGADGIPIGSIALGRDVTERKRTEQAIFKREKRLQEQQAFLESIYHGVDAQIFVVDVTQDGDFRYADNNLAHQRITGLKGKRFIGKRPEGLMPDISSELAASLRNNYERCVKCGKTIRYEEKGTIKGQPLWCLTQLAPLKDETGRITRIVGISTEITKRKQMEKVLKEERNKLKAIVGSMEYGLTIQDRDYNIIYQNEVIKSVFGNSKGKKCYRVYESSNKICDGCPVHMAWIDGRSHTVERTVTMPSGQYACWENTASPVRGARGEMVACLEITRNVTERRRTEEALRESERKYRDLVENINDAIYATNETGTLTYISPVIGSITGYDPSELIGRSYLEFVHPEDISAIAGGFKDLKAGKLYPSEYRIIAKDNREVWIHTFNRPVLEQGRFAGVRGVMTDITERKKLIQQLIQSEKSAAVGTLAYGIAHEFNNILAGIMVNAEYGSTTTDIRQIKECLNVIVEATQRGASITNSLLAVAGEKQRKRGQVDITGPLQNVLSFTRRELQMAGIKVVEDIKPVPAIFCDPGEFTEVFLNMVNNARDSMVPKGGTLSVKIDHVGDDIRITLKDTGCGIPKEIKDKIFDPFVTTKGALGKGEVAGTGLGLFVTYGIVDSYGGKIDIHSRPGKGTTFTISIPVSTNLPPEPVSRKDVEFCDEAKGKLNILLIDDEKIICSILKRFLKSKGHQVTASLEGRDAMKQLKRQKFDVVLSDIAMPGMDGIEIIKRVKEKDREIKVVAISGHVRREKLEEAKEAGADEVLSKPFRNKELYEIILGLYKKTQQKDRGEEAAD